MKDIERPLNKRGEKDASKVGKLLAEQELVPQLILCSSATRARKTAEIVIAKCGYAGEVMYLDSFYLAEPSVYLDVLRVLPDNLERVLVVGHNPGLEAVLQMLSGRVESLPTASVAYISLAIDHWSQVDEDSKGDLVQLWRPREL